MKFGEGRLSALGVAIPFGVIMAGAAGAVALATDSVGPYPVFGATVVALVLLWPCVGLVWALIVDRETLQGATENPEQSVESAWYSRASSGAFGDTLLVTGLGAAAIGVANIPITAPIALSAVLLIALGSWAIRYLLLRRRG
ncbi:hypothetical protein [Microbacterium sp.]|uniref:hypothetical protein n=1 Tax=Microbacterium sp. TaxID=51671 RepID=UPI0033401DB0